MPNRFGQGPQLIAFDSHLPKMDEGPKRRQLGEAIFTHENVDLLNTRNDVSTVDVTGLQ